MVLNEAAAAGLPLVATEESGAAHDLIETANGFRVAAGDVARFATRCAARGGPELRRAAGRALTRARGALHARGVGGGRRYRGRSCTATYWSSLSVASSTPVSSTTRGTIGVPET